MRRFNKRFLLITILCCSTMLTGCNVFGFNDYEDAADNDITGVQNEIEDSGEKTDNEKPAEDEKPTSSAIAPAVMSELTVYTVDSNEELETVTISIPKDTDITPELIVDKVVEVIADRDLKVGIENVTSRDDTVIVSFTSDTIPADGNCSEKLEVTILNAIGQSLTENLQDYKHVIFQEEGQAYKGGHISFEIDEPYI
jgi:hypothetical protein